MSRQRGSGVYVGVIRDLLDYGSVIVRSTCLSGIKGQVRASGLRITRATIPGGYHRIALVKEVSSES